MADRRGERNPFHGKKHTEEWKREASLRTNTWTTEELDTIRRWYVQHAGIPLRLDDLAKKLGRPKTSVCRTARACGVVHKKPPRKPRSRAKYATEAERKRAIGAAARERIAKNGHPRGMKGKTQSAEFCRAQSEYRRGKSLDLSDEQRQALSDRMSALAATRSNSNAYSRTKYGTRDDLAGRFFRSSWEANYARFLNWMKATGHIADWDYEAETFWFEKIKRGVRSYKPDFKVTNTDGSIHYVEVKGWMDAKSKTKIARMARYHPTVDLRVVDEKAYRAIERSVGCGLAGWEMRRKARPR